MNEADLLIVFGASFSNHTGITSYKPIVQVDYDPMTLGRFHSVTVPVWGEIGVTAHLVLVRTRDLGTIAEQPASLSAFNHAIVYVPSLDLFMDGTAEYSGAFELPSMDQGASVAVYELDTGKILAASKLADADQSWGGVMRVAFVGEERNSLRRYCLSLA